MLPYTLLHDVISDVIRFPSVPAPHTHLGSNRQPKEKEKPARTDAKPKPSSTGLQSRLSSPKRLSICKIRLYTEQQQQVFKPKSSNSGEKKPYSFGMSLSSVIKRGMNRIGAATDFGKCHYFNALKG